MSVEQYRILVAIGFFVLLLLLRLDAQRFHAAEYDEPGRRAREINPILLRLAWYALAALFLGAIYVVHPQPHDVLYLLPGRRPDVFVWGFGLALLGSGQAVIFAQYRYGYLRLPRARAYPGAALNALATACIDEATFRGVLLGAVISAGAPASAAVPAAALFYVLTTRLAAPGRSRYMVVPALGYGLLGGAATLATGGIGAAIVGHAVTAFMMFVCTGHAGQAAPLGKEPEEAAPTPVPLGWRRAD